VTGAVNDPDTAPNLNDASRCPLGVRCECCGVERADLAVIASDLGSVGVACLTMCPSCAASTVSPPVAVGTAVRLVLQHAAHVGVACLDASELIERYRPTDTHSETRSPHLHDVRAGETCQVQFGATAVT
jgi:hypothetical protein